MKTLFPALLLWSSLLVGCSHLGYYKREKAEWAPPEESEKLRFPTSYEQGAQLDGTTTTALAVAMNDFLPPGARFRDDDDEQIARCLSRWDTYDISILKANDNLIFVRFTPSLARCGIDTSIHVILDIGAEYAIDGKGRILDMH